MPAPQQTIRFHQSERSILVQVEGWGTMAKSYAFRRLVEKCLAEGVQNIRIDLRRCTYLDSTFLGTLLTLKRAVDRGGQGSFLLVSPSTETLQLLQHMNFDALFTIVEAEEPAVGLCVELQSEPLDADTSRHNIVQVHRELASLPGEVGDPFRAMVRGLEQEMEAHK